MDTEQTAGAKKSGCLKIALISICAALLASILTFWVAKTYIFPKEFKPVQLNAREEKILETKIEALTSPPPKANMPPAKPRQKSQPQQEQRPPLTPERYDETNASRTIQLTEREINGLVAKNTDMADKLAIDLSDDLASAKLLVPLDPEFPFLGGKTLKVTAGMELRYGNGRPVVILKGVSIWGVPIPNAWLGGIKNIDLIREFGMNQGFWSSFAAGVEGIHIEDGNLTIELKH